MKRAVILTVFSLLGHIALGQFTGTVHPALQKRGQAYLTTLPVTTVSPLPSTTISMSPQTSISVHHTIVRNKPAYPYPYTESTLQTDATDDSSYYYTYEDISADDRRTSTPSSMTTTSTTKPAVKSFWNSQKALLDARRKEGSQKYMSTYSRLTSGNNENKPVVEFKAREKPKFGVLSKNKYTTTTTTAKPEMKDQKDSNNKAVKLSINDVKLQVQKITEKDEGIKNAKSASSLIPNQIVGRIGEIPVQNNLASQIQSALRAQSARVNGAGSSRSSKFDESVGNVQFIDNPRQIQLPQQTSARNNLQPAALLKNLDAQTLLKLNQQAQQLLNANQQAQQLLNANQQAQSRLNLNTQPQPLANVNQQLPLLNTNQQSLLNNLNTQPAAAFIVASPPASTSARSGEVNGNVVQPSSLLSRLGALANLANGGGLDGGLVQGRDGGGGGFTLNLGAVPDPLTFILRLLSLIPRPLLDLQGRMFFGIELGKNAGLVAGTGGKPAYG